MKIMLANFSDRAVLSLIQGHLSGMRSESPPENVCALEVSGLQSSDIQLWTLWDGESLLGMAALRSLGPKWGELKSMRTSASHLRKGVAKALLEHIISEARGRGYEKLSLETGSGPAFEPAIQLYQKYGFVKGEKYGDYSATEFNQFFHLHL